MAQPSLANEIPILDINHRVIEDDTPVGNVQSEKQFF